MRNTLTIFRREFASLFGQPLAAISLAVFVAVVAAFSLYFNDLLLSGVATMDTPFFWTAIAFLMFAPAVTMRTLSEEKRTGTIEMLMTLPITATEVVLGKWMASCALMLVGLVLLVGYPLALEQYAVLDWGPVFGGFIGLALLGGAFCAIGVSASSLTDNQVVAFMLAFFVGLVPFAMGFFLPVVPADLVPLVQYFTFEYHFSNLAKGVLDSRSVVFYLGVIALFLQGAVTMLETRRLQ